SDDALAPELDVAPQAGTRALNTEENAAQKEDLLELHLIPLRAKESGDVQPLYDVSGGAASRVHLVGETGQWFDALKQGTVPFNIPPAVWMALLDGSGWATEGPGGGNAH
ncbi:MAG: hypothetical protein KDE47_31400, partial [Caldilineaceae bacterium]|nr:hypothetical protein [Caldilineaceae bacterium]